MGFYAQRIGDSPSKIRWKFIGWQRGQNSYADDNEIRDTEYYNGINVELVGKGSVRLPRRGCRLFAKIENATKFNGWGVYTEAVSGNSYLIVMANGRLYKITASGEVSEIDNTQTWNENARMRGVQMRNWFYFGSKENYLSKTNGTTVVRWQPITKVSNLSLSLSGSGNEVLYSYTVTAVTATGETEYCTPVSSFGPYKLDNNNYFSLTWTRKTDSNVVGYNIYKSTRGTAHYLLTYLDQKPSGATMTFYDKGIEKSTSLLYEAPSYNTTAGVSGDIVGKYANTLFVAGVRNEPDTVFYTGTGDGYESFSPDKNGGWVKPGRGDGEQVTGLIGFDDFLFIFKENSIWRFTFGSDGAPTLAAAIPEYGTSSTDSIRRLEKDIMFYGSDNRIRTLGYAPTQLNVIYTTDISNRVQNKIDLWQEPNLQNIHAITYEQKYILCNRSEAIAYDRRYLGFLGVWSNYKYDAFLIWDANTGKQKCYGFEKDTGEIHQILCDYVYDDNGKMIEAVFQPKTIDGGEYETLKYFRNYHVRVKNALGRIRIDTYIDNTLYASDVYDYGGVSDYTFEAFAWDEAYWEETNSIVILTYKEDIITKNIYDEAYKLSCVFTVQGNANNIVTIQEMAGFADFEDYDYMKNSLIK